MTQPYQLSPYQYQLGGLTFGRGTDIPINQVQIQTYNINKQDFQVVRTDEIRFGIDTLSPSTISFQMGVTENWVLENIAGSQELNSDLFPVRGTIVSELAKIWKANSIRAVWGSTAQLYFCDRDGNVVMIFGRPGKFQYDPKVSDRDAYINIQAEFRRGDTYAHSYIEYFVGSVDGTKGLAPGDPAVTAYRLDGDADSWVRFLFNGPMKNPVVNYGGNVLELNLTIPSGVQVEVNTYPWTRRIVDTNGNNWRTALAGATMYLDQINFPCASSYDISWSCENADADTGMYFLWREAYNVI
jgi:hypothetical protein